MILFIVIDFTSQIQRFINLKGVPWYFTLEYYALKLPTAIYDLSPIIYVVACSAVVIKFHKHNEFVASMSLGISIRQIINPIIVSLFIISIGLFFFKELVIVNLATPLLKRELQLKYGGKQVVKDVYLFLDRGKLILAEEYYPKLRKFNKLFYVEDSPNELTIIRAQEVFADSNWQAKMLQKVRYDKLSQKYTKDFIISEFLDLHLPLNQLENIFKVITKGKIGEIYNVLKTEIAGQNAVNKLQESIGSESLDYELNNKTLNLKIEILSRFSKPLLTIIISLLVMLISVALDINTIAKGLTLIGLACFSFYLVTFVTLEICRLNIIEPIFIIFFPIVAFTVPLIYMYKSIST